MRLSSPRHKAEGNGGGCGCVALVLVAVAVLVVVLRQTPEGKLAVRMAVASVQPPVAVRLSPFLVFNGYYVLVTNTSAETTLTDVLVMYTAADGTSMTQAVGTLRPGETKVLDPSDIGWTVEKHETISVTAAGYIPKVVETNALLAR